VKRILVELRLIVVVVVLAALVTLAVLATVPTQHFGTFSGSISAQVNEDYSSASATGMSVGGIPAGAQVAFNWTSETPSANASVEAFSGSNPGGFNAVACYVSFSTIGSCAWTANGDSYTIAIEGGGGCPACSNSTTYEVSVLVTGWFVYSGPVLGT
jgi:hypothetical protein